MKLKNILILLVSFIFLNAILASTLSIFKLADATTIYDKFGGLILGVFTALRTTRYIPGFIFIFQMIGLFLFFLLVIAIQMGIYKILLKKIENIWKVFKAIFCGNIVSLLIGVVFYIFIFLITRGHNLLYMDASSFSMGNLKYPLGMYLGGIGCLFNNICYFLICFYSEYIVSRNLLNNDYEDRQIKNAVLCSNITKSFVPVLFSIIIMLQGQDINTIKMFIEREPDYFYKYCFGVIILPLVLIGVGIFIAKKYINNQKNGEK